MTAKRRKLTGLQAKIDRPIALVGMMGAGKTTVGRRLAHALELPFRDVDAEIESASGLTVSELFSKHGEESFRKGEAQVIERLLGGAPLVIATGGGALTTAATRALIAESAISIWIRADIDTLVKRATKRPTRPLLKNGDPRAIILELLAQRTAFYEAANIVVDTSAGNHSQTVEAIIKQLSLYLCGAHDL